MPHNGARYVVANILPHIIAARPGAYPITHIDAATLEPILKHDASEYFYSATVSTASALLSITTGYYSWATVKLYYSDYYLLRGMLALARLCIFYEGNKPRTLRALPLDLAITPGGRRNATTHGVVIEAAKTHLGHLVPLSQDIAGENPLDWIRERREEANYWHARCPEPVAPSCMKICERYGIRRLVTDYLSDTRFTYAFDPDHAMLAYNLLLWRHLRDELERAGQFAVIEDEDFTYLRSLFSDRDGPLGPMQQLLTLVKANGD
jgi:hypothetical protein